MTNRNARSMPDRRFGRRASLSAAMGRVATANPLSDDLRLFALTFAGGFLFMTIYLA